MAGRLNRFGCQVDTVLSFMNTGSYTPQSSDFGGDGAVGQFMDLAVDEIIQMMPEDMFQSMFDVQLEKVELRASAGQTAFQVSLFPTVNGKTHVWKGQPVMFKSRPRLLTDLLVDMTFTDPELIPLAELNANLMNPNPATDQYSFNDTTGKGALASFYTCLQNDMIFASYSVDPTQLNILSLQQLVCQGCWAKMGPKFFARATSQWQFIDDIREDYTQKIKDLRKGEWIPPEIRIMRFWEERIPEADKKAIMQVGRLIRA